MNDRTEEILREHAARYPAMQPQDAVKLLYQNEFGPGHFVSDARESGRRIAAEYDACGHDRDIPMAEEIGNGYVRCHLNSRTMGEDDLPSLNRVFLLSAKRMAGSRDSFQAKLKALLRLSEEGIFCFDRQEAERYLAVYEKDGFPMVSHSDLYRKTYAPAYRVAEGRLCRLFPLLREMERLRSEQGRVIVAFDGRCAAGKTSAAKDVAEMFCGEIIHMDDFFLPPELRSRERYEEAGGNVHYERFREEVVCGLRSGKEFSYRIFNCRKMDYDGERKIRGDGVVIVEGAYGMHPSFGQPYDLTVFFDVEQDEQKRRIIRRDGRERLSDFEEKWIPLEEKYIKDYNLDKRCKIIMK